jgi:pilus assembly protein Flp/PilA
MRRAVKLCLAMLGDEAAASALEYGLVVGLIALVIIAGLALAGKNLSALFNLIGSEVSNITPSA